MRLAPTLVVSSLAGALLPFASASHSPTRSLASLQHHQPRYLIDLCLSIPQLAVDLLSLLGVNAELCLCLQDLDLYLQTTDNVTLQNAALANVNLLLGQQGENAQCAKVPPHAHRACVKANPCHFECDTGFVAQNGQCVCPAPNVICGDKCAPLSPACRPSSPSAIARSLKLRESPITTLEAAQATCGSKTVCGVPQPKNENDFECLDVTNNFDSCGGCVYPHPFQSKSTAPRGTDCRSISNARHVSCQNSKCVVQQCRQTYTISANRDACLSGKARRDLISIGGKPISLDGSILGISLGGDTSSSQILPVDPSSSAVVIDPSLAPSMVGMMTAAQGVSTANLPSTGPITPSTVAPVMSAVQGVLASTADKLPANIDAAVTATQALQLTVTQCNCDGLLGNLVHTVVDLLHHLLGLQQSCSGGTAPTVPGPASCLHVDASKTVCGILPGVYVGPVVLCGLLGPGLTDTVQGLVNGLGLNAACPTAPSAAVIDPSLAPSMVGMMTAAQGVSTANLPSTGPITPSTVAPAISAVHSVLASTAENLPANVDTAVTAAQALQSTITQCNCDGLLGNLVHTVVDLLHHLLGLQKSCGGGTAPTVPGPASCLHVDASKTVCGILPGVYVGPVVLCGLLGPGLTNTVQGLVNGLGLNAACPTAPSAAAIVPGTATLNTSPPLAAVIDPSLAPSMVGMMTAAQGVSTANLPSSGLVTTSTVAPVMSAVQGVLASTADKLPANIDAAVTATQALQSTITQCNCDGLLGNLVHTVIDLLHHLLGLQQSCSGGTAPTVPGPASCLHVDASKTVCGILPGVYVGPVVLCGLLGPGLTNTVQGLVNGLGLNAACPTAPSATAPPATLPPGTLPPTSTNASTTTPPSTVIGAPADPDTVIKLAGLCINLGVTIKHLVSNLPCDGLLHSVNTLVQNLLGDGLLKGVVSGRQLALGGLLGSLLGGTNPVTPTIKTVLSTVTAVSATCAVGGLASLLSTLANTVDKLVSAVGSCGCGDDPDVMNAVSALQTAAAAKVASLPAPTAPVKRSFRTRSRTGHANYLRAEPDAVLAPQLVGPMTSALALAAAIEGMQSTMPPAAPNCTSMLSSLSTLFASSSTILNVHLDWAVIETRAFQTALASFSDKLKLGKMVEFTDRLLASLVQMQSYCDANPATVSATAPCDGANVSHEVCGLLPSLWYLGRPILCGLASQFTSLPKDVQNLCPSAPLEL